MAKTKKVNQRRNLRKKQKSRRFGRGKEQMVAVALSKMLSKVSEDTYGQEFHDNGKPSVVSRILSYLPIESAIEAIEATEKAEYKRRLEEALILNQKILSDQEALIKQLKMSGVDGPARRTRSKGRYATDPVLEELELEAYHTRWAIVQITGILSHLKNNPTYMPYGFTNYGDTLIERPGWDMPRMTNTARFRPPGYPNWR